MNESNESSWRDLYRAAVLESDSSLFRVRVNEALAAINARASDGHWVPRDVTSGAFQYHCVSCSVATSCAKTNETNSSKE
jgi:hypothetical protein